MLLAADTIVDDVQWQTSLPATCFVTLASALHCWQHVCCLCCCMFLTGEAPLMMPTGIHAGCSVLHLHCFWLACAVVWSSVLSMTVKCLQCSLRTVLLIVRLLASASLHVASSSVPTNSNQRMPTCPKFSDCLLDEPSVVLINTRQHVEYQCLWQPQQHCQQQL